MNKAVLFLFLVLAVFEARATPRYRERYSLDEEGDVFFPINPQFGISVNCYEKIEFMQLHVSISRHCLLS